MLPTSGSIRRYFPIQFVVPITLLLGSGFGCLLALLIHTTMVQDRMERAREIELVENGLTTTAQMVMHDLQDYAHWDEAVQNLYGTLNVAWADDNISTYLGTVQHYDHVLLLDEANRVVYDFAGNRNRGPGLKAGGLLGSGFVAAMRRVRASGPGRNPIVAGYTGAGGDIYVFSAAGVTPVKGMALRPAMGMRVLVVARRVKRPFIRELARLSRLPPLALTDQRGAGTALSLTGHDGRRVGWITWESTRPGTKLRNRVLPAFVFVVLIALAAAALILRRARRGMDALRRSEANAQDQALHDALTGLANRRAMIERLAATDGPVMLLYMDLDGFKETNDVYGHAAGDELLIEAARRIGAAAAGADLVARSGGDEFAVVLASPGGRPVAHVAEEIRAAFQAPFAVGGYSVSAGISIGSAEMAGGGGSAELIRRADVAMYVAKANGKDCWCVYDPKMDEEHHERRQLEGELRHAIANGRIAVEFQPIVDAADRITGVEALARWRHPRHGPIPPDIFIRVAERTGLINDLGRCVLTIACREALSWNVDLAVNLSPAQFWDRTLVCRVRETLAATGFPAHRLELEITESYLLRRPDAAEAILRELRALGIRIALDDFGTGFASIGYLRRLSFDRIKIDRSFVTDVATNVRSADMARAIVALAQALDLAVTAEGIETAAQATIMRLIGCTRLQGWLFGRPMPAAAMTERLGQAETAVRLPG